MRISGPPSRAKYNILVQSGTAMLAYFVDSSATSTAGEPDPQHGFAVVAEIKSKR
jgi:hypothetical protein